MRYFITPTELAQKLDQFVILDCRSEASHLPSIAGAIAVPNNYLWDAPTAHGGRHPLLNMDMFREKMELCGISNDTEVVIVEDWFNLGGRLWWMLQYIGVTSVKVLLGGLDAWLAAGFSTEMGRAEKPQKGTITGGFKRDWLVSYEEVQQITQDKSKVLIDVRAPGRYRGEVEPLDTKAGHIPTAVNVFYDSFYTRTGLIELEKIEKILDPIKNDGRKVVVYCGSGITAPIGMMAMAEAGLDTALYLGSFSDWLSYPDSSIMTGEETL